MTTPNENAASGSVVRIREDAKSEVRGREAEVIATSRKHVRLAVDGIDRGWFAKTELEADRG